MSKLQLSIKIQVTCMLCVQGLVDGKPCPQCRGAMHWEQEMPLERAVLMFRDYLVVAEQAEREEKIAKAEAGCKQRRSPILLLGES